MAAKKTPKKKASKKSAGPKRLGLFDHLNAVKSIQNPKYFDTISDDDKKTWSTWMILKALSYNIDYLPVANWAQRMISLPPEYMYKVLIDLIPRQRTFDTFIKSKNEGKHDAVVIDLIAKFFVISTSESIGYLNIFASCDAGKLDLANILKKHGYTEKEIKKLKL